MNLLLNLVEYHYFNIIIRLVLLILLIFPQNYESFSNKSTSNNNNNSNNIKGGNRDKSNPKYFSQSESSEVQYKHLLLPSSPSFLSFISSSLHQTTQKNKKNSGSVMKNEDILIKNNTNSFSPYGQFTTRTRGSSTNNTKKENTNKNPTVISLLSPTSSSQTTQRIKRNLKLAGSSSTNSLLLQEDNDKPSIITNMNGGMSRDSKKILRILGLFELSFNNGTRRELGESEKAAAEMAIEDVNRNTKGMLPGYKLVMISNDTQSDPGVRVNSFFHSLYQGRKDKRGEGNTTKIISLLLGSGSEISISKVATHQRVVQVSFGSTSPSLSDRKEFPLFYRTVSPTSSHAQAIIELMKTFGWDAVTFFTQNENRYTMPVNYLTKEMEDKGNITCHQVTFSLSDLEEQLNILLENDARIVIASFSVQAASRLFCEVYRRKMFGPDYAWIWIGKPSKLWWQREPDTNKNTSLPSLSQGKLFKSEKQLRNPTDPIIPIPLKLKQIQRETRKNNDINVTRSHDDETIRPLPLSPSSLRMKVPGGSVVGTKDPAISTSTTATTAKSTIRPSIKHQHHQLPSSSSSSMSIMKCSPKQLVQAIEGTLVFDRFNMLEEGRLSESGMTTESFGRRLEMQMRKGRGLKSESGESTPSLSPFAPETYDAIWTIAYGLHKVWEKYNYSLENFFYKDDYFAHLLNEEIGGLKFTGISGPITFSGSDRIGITSFMQIQDGALNQVGLFHPDREPERKLELMNCSETTTKKTRIFSGGKLLEKPDLPCGTVKWPGNQVPIARREFRTKVVRVKPSLYIFVGIVAFLGILLAVVFLAFNLYYRKLKYIKLSSPNLNNMVIIGCMFAYISVIILGDDFGGVATTPTSTTTASSGGQGQGQGHIRVSYVCTLRAYLLSSAFSLAFGAMFAKTYRVHRIFTRSCIGVVKNKLLKDTQLMTLVMALLVIDVIIVTTWAIADPMRRELQNLTVQKDERNRSVVWQLQIEVCRSQHGHVWLGVMYAYKSLLLVVGIYMAYETRHVKIQALNDSKNIVVCIYIVVLTSVLAVSLANLISDRVTLSFLCVTSLILLSTTVTLCVLFLPKIHTIKTGGHKGDPVVESMGLKIEFNTRRLVVEEAKELMFRAEVQNRVYKRQIEAIDVEIWRLENLLLCSNSNSTASLDNATAMKGKGVLHQGTDQKPTLDGDARNPAEDEYPSTSSSQETSEIYTVYLHGPRFIVPISVLNFQNPKATAPSTAITFTPSLEGDEEGQQGIITRIQKKRKQSKDTSDKDTLQPPIITPPPRSSWPNIRSFLSPYSTTNGLPKIRFKSEPKLVTDENERSDLPHVNPTPPVIIQTTEEPSLLQDELLLSPRVTFGGGESSDDNILMEMMRGSTSRKSSTGSGFGGTGITRGKIRASFLSLLKQPFTYFQEKVKGRGGGGGGSGCSTNTSPSAKRKEEVMNYYYSYVNDDDDNDEEDPSTRGAAGIFHLRVPTSSSKGDSSIRQKFSSVPDELWAIRASSSSSPVFQNYPKKTSIASDSVVDTRMAMSFMEQDKNQKSKSKKKRKLASRRISTSNPVLKLTVTSDESPYL